MSSVSFYTNIRNQWNSLETADKTSLKFTSLAVITAIAFAAIALTLHFTMHGQPIEGWTVDSLLMATVLPAGFVSVTSCLLLAVLYRQCKKRERELQVQIQRQVEDPASRIHEDTREGIGRWCEAIGVPLNTLKSSYREEIKREEIDLISTLRKLKEGILVPSSNEEKEILLLAPLLNSLTTEERELCVEFGIDPEKCWIFN